MRKESGLGGGGQGENCHHHKVTILKAGSAFLREVMSTHEGMEEVAKVETARRPQLHELDCRPRWTVFRPPAGCLSEIVPAGPGAKESPARLAVQVMYM